MPSGASHHSGGLEGQLANHQSCVIVETPHDPGFHPAVHLYLVELMREGLVMGPNGVWESKVGPVRTATHLGHMNNLCI